jgi:Kinesin-associated protein (KAP)
MEEMIEHESLIPAISRTLRDEYKKSLDMSLYLLNVFYAYSHFTDFHSLLIQNQIGDTCQKIIDYEIKRYIARVNEYTMRMKMVKEAQETPNADTDLKELQNLFRKEEKRLIVTVKKQEKVLFVTFHILLNLAEDLQVEREMKEKGIVKQLMSILERNNPDLLYIVLSFLKKLSVFGSNKDAMLEAEIVKKLNRFIPCQNALLTQTALRLLFNLSFDIEIREGISAIGMIPKLVELLKVAQYRSILLRILYHLSSDDKIKATFAYTSCIPLVYQLVIHFPDPIIGKELIALAINLTTNKTNAALISQDEQLEALMQRAFKYHDVLLFRVIRNIAQFGPVTNIDIYEKYMDDILELTKQSGDNTDLQIELIGTLVYINSEKWDVYLTEGDFLDFVHSNLVSDYSEDDLVLETIMLIGTMCRSEKCADAIANSYVIGMLHELLGAKQEDDEMVQQILYTYHRLLYYRVTREIMLEQTQIVNVILELLNDKNPNIRKLVNSTLDLVQLHDEMWKQEIKIKKFEMHNEVYLGLMEEYEAQAQGLDDEALYDYYAQDPEALAALEEGEFDEDQWFDQNDLAQRIWNGDEMTQEQYLNQQQLMQKKLMQKQYMDENNMMDDGDY